MKSLLLGSCSTIALVCSVQAADLPVKAPPPAPVVWSWAGPYIGIHGGVVSHRGEFDDPDGFLNRAFAVTPPTTYSADKTGGIFGGHAGYNLQSGSIVYGIEADVSGMSAKGSTTRPSEPTSFANFQVRWLATIRGRLGVTVTPATLLYATGGVAFGDVRNHSGVAAANIEHDRGQDSKPAGRLAAASSTCSRAIGPFGRKSDMPISAPTPQPAHHPAATADFQVSGRVLQQAADGLVGVSLKF